MFGSFKCVYIVVLSLEIVVFDYWVCVCVSTDTHRDKQRSIFDHMQYYDSPKMHSSADKNAIPTNTLENTSSIY